MTKCRACGGRLRRDWPKRFNPVTGQPDYFHERCYRLFCERYWPKETPAESKAAVLRDYWNKPDRELARQYVDYRQPEGAGG